MSATEDQPPDPLAEAADVRGVIATSLDDPEIESFVADAAFENWQANDTDAMSDALREQIEKWYGAYLVRSVRDRDFSKADRDSTSLTYDGSVLTELRRKVRSLDPSGELVPDDEAATRRSASVGTARLHAADGIGDDPDRKRTNGHRVLEGVEESQ